MTAILKRFRVRQFRSITDSDWIDTDDITALIGTNESGKTNLLVALWKLKPAKSGKIDLIADLPRKSYHSLRDAEVKPVFIEAEFVLDEPTVRKIIEITGAEADAVRCARVTRSFDNKCTITFPAYKRPQGLPAGEVRGILEEANAAIDAAGELKGESGLKKRAEERISSVLGRLSTESLATEGVRSVLQEVTGIRPGEPMKTSELVPAIDSCVKKLSALVTRLQRKAPDTFEEARNLAWSSIPPIVYYSTYGNLDSEIYLPHVIANLEREDLGEKEEAKARTLRVLFEFVQLSPKEILTLGQEAPAGQTPEQVTEAARRKKEREILLQSASTDLTGKFREWWRQGDYLFRFQADGNHFRIWVSDDRRPEQIELEARSSGLQWFFSFYLVFLVEAEDAHEDAILLLDEPGLSLHPVSQQDLSSFFKGLAQKNQLLYTTHSPFMVDADRLDRVKAVFVEPDGSTGVSSDLRVGAGDSSRVDSIYPVHAALGLSVSDALLQGCQTVVVEGPSDQHYLSLVKILLIREGLLKPPRELVFVPAGGVKGVKAIAGILSAKDTDLPYVVLDSDTAGVQFASHLKKGLYASCKDRVVMIGDHYDAVADPEVEDLLPTEVWAYEVTRLLRGPEPEFDDVVDSSVAVCDQVVAYAREHEVQFDQPGWKVEVASRVKQRLLRSPNDFDLASKKGEAWKEIFNCITGGSDKGES